jgi:glucose/arabinose dehydrogenase
MGQGLGRNMGMKNLLAAFMFLLASASNAPAALPGTLRVPPGFKLSLAAEGLAGVRGMAFSPSGELTVCLMDAGEVRRLGRADGNGSYLGTQTLIRGLQKPHSLAFHDGSLFVGETQRVSRFPDDGSPRDAQEGHRVVDLPPGGRHFTRTIAFSPGGWLAVSVGSDCNTCEEKDKRLAAILKVDPVKGTWEVLASGIRNAVGLAFQPGTGLLFASGEERDLLGDDVPPEPILKIRAGADYGWPYAYSLGGRMVPDPDYGNRKKGPFQPAFYGIQAHSTPLSILFYRGHEFPARYREGFFLALHGSWNRSIPVGYKVVFVPMRNGKPGKPEDFLAAREGVERSFRPVQLLETAEGDLLVSDDRGGRIARVAWKGN